MVSVETQTAPVLVLVLGGVPGSDVDNRYGAAERGASVNGEILTTHGVLDGTSRISRGWKNMAHGRHSGYLKLVQMCTIA